MKWGRFYFLLVYYMYYAEKRPLLLCHVPVVAAMNNQQNECRLFYCLLYKSMLSQLTPYYYKLDPHPSYTISVSAPELC